MGTVQKVAYRRGIAMMPKVMFLDILPDGYTEADLFHSEYELEFKNINSDYKLITTGEPTVTKANFKRFPKAFKPEEFDYGYCVTCHKSQGSEYDKVLVFEEHLRGGDHARWLYTAATRAKKKLVIVRAS